MVPVKIDKDLVPDHLGNAPCIGFLPARDQSYVALSEISKLVVNNEYQAFFKGIIKKLLSTFDLFRQEICSIVGYGFP